MMLLPTVCKVNFAKSGPWEVTKRKISESLDSPIEEALTLIRQYSCAGNFCECCDIHSIRCWWPSKLSGDLGKILSIQVMASRLPRDLPGVGS